MNAQKGKITGVFKDGVPLQTYVDQEERKEVGKEFESEVGQYRYIKGPVRQKLTFKQRGRAGKVRYIKQEVNMEKDMAQRVLEEIEQKGPVTITGLVRVLEVKKTSLRTLLRRIELTIPDYLVATTEKGVKRFSLLTTATQALEAWRNTKRTYKAETHVPRIPKQEKLPSVEKEVPTDIRVTLPELVVRVFVSVNITFGKGE